MKTLSLLAVPMTVLTLALPAAASEPSKPKRLERQVAALHAKAKRLGRQVAVLQRSVRRLEAERKALRQAQASVLRRERALLLRIVAADPCPITRPNGSVPPGSTFGAEFHGNGALWVGVPPANVVLTPKAADGSVGTKFGWWREAIGALTIDGRRLDGPAPLLRAAVPDGYGDRGFQPSSITFPSEGCWEVTGRVGGATLTFVTLALGE